MLIAYGCHDRNWPPIFRKITESQLPKVKKRMYIPEYIALGMLQIYLHHLKTLKIMSNLIKNCYVEVVKKNNSDRLKNRKLCSPLNS